MTVCRFCSFLAQITLSQMSRSPTKPTKWHMRPAKTQISLGICPVWSVFAMRSMGSSKDLKFLHADSKDWSDWADAQTDLSLCWAHIILLVLSGSISQKWIYIVQYMKSHKQLLMYISIIIHHIFYLDSIISSTSWKNSKEKTATTKSSSVCHVQGF